MKAVLWLFSGLFCLSVLADPVVQVQLAHGISRGAYPVAVGSDITMTLPGTPEQHPGEFLGRIVQQDGTLSMFMLLDTQSQSVLYVPAQNTAIEDRGLQNVLDPYAQVGGTCTGYAMDHFMVQSEISGLHGNGALARTLSTEPGRTNLLVDAVNQYYLVLQHRFSIAGILNGYGKQFGFSCVSKTFQSSPQALTYLKSQLSTGLPVLVSFNVGPTMRTSPFHLTTLANGAWTSEDQRVWSPRKAGERNEGGHSVVAASYFEYQGHLELLMIDSDWDKPRVWDAENYFDAKTAIGEVEFITCR